jgi:hypothetical protein
LAADDLACEDAAPRGRAVSTQLSCDLRFPLGPRTTAVAVLRSMQSTRYASTGHAGCQAAGIHTAQEPPMRPAGAGLRRLQPGRLPHEHPRRRQSEDRLRPHPRSGRAAPEQGSTHAGRKRLTPNKLGGKYIAGLIYRPSEVPDIFFAGILEPGTSPHKKYSASWDHTGCPCPVAVSGNGNQSGQATTASC